MVEFGILTGCFSFVIFSLGLLGKLGKLQINISSILYLISIFILVLFKTKNISFKNIYKIIITIKYRNHLLEIAGLILILLFALINLIGAIGPELGFDALWYHLTIPKIYLQNQRILFLPGGLFYYSAMPKLMESLYLVSLNYFESGILAKLTHYFFGILCLFSLYNLSIRFLSKKMAILAVLLFYSCLLVSWESTTAYIDLGRTFFEILAVKLFLEWGEDWDKVEKKGKEDKTLLKLIESAIMVGLAVSTKLLSFGSLLIFLIILFIKTKDIRKVFIFFSTALLVVSPYLIFSFIATGNPFYPVFSNILDNSHKIQSFNMFKIFSDLWKLFYKSNDPLSPIYLMFFPIIILNINKLFKQQFLFLYLIFSLLFWYFVPRTGGSRFYLPYLPAVTIVLLFSIVNFNNLFVKKFFYSCLFFIAIINLIYRAGAVSKNVKYLFGRQSTQSYLIKNLKFNEGDFLDLNQDIKRITNGEKVLIFGSHNLFYADFPFDHQSYTSKDNYYSYFLTQNTSLPVEYNKHRLIYENKITDVKLYIGGKFSPFAK